MKDHALITVVAVGAVIAAICCATALVAVALGAFELTAWLAKADYAVIPALLAGLGLVASGLSRRRTTTDCCAPTPNKQDVKP